MLIVDDHEATRRALGRFFRIMGCEVVTAEDVGSALRSLDPPPDHVILDLELPDGRGEAVLREIRRDGLPTSVAVCTGTCDAERLRAIEDLTPEALLLKPISVDDVFRVYSIMIGREELGGPGGPPAPADPSGHRVEGHEGEHGRGGRAESDARPAPSSRTEPVAQGRSREDAEAGGELIPPPRLAGFSPRTPDVHA